MAKLKIVWTETATIVFQQILTFYNVRNGNTQYSRSIYTFLWKLFLILAKILIRLLFRGGFVCDGMERISVFCIICLSNQNVRYVSTH